MIFCDKNEELINPREIHTYGDDINMGDFDEGMIKLLYYTSNMNIKICIYVATNNTIF